MWQIGDEWSKLISSDHTLNPILFKLGWVRVGSRGGGIFWMRSCSNRPVVSNQIFRVCRNPVIFIFLWPTMKNHQKSSKIWRKEWLNFPLKKVRKQHCNDSRWFNILMVGRACLKVQLYHHPLEEIEYAQYDRLVMNGPSLSVVTTL